MRRIINSTYITLDGVIENPQDWPSDEFDEASGAIQTELLFACDAVLMGRHTYDGFAPVWSGRSGDPYSDRMNSMEKIVVSTSLQDPQWSNTTVVGTDPITEIARLKEQPGSDIIQYGFGQLSYALMEDHLIDELHLWIHPVFIGSGGPESLLYRNGPLTSLRLSDTRTLTNGIVILSYQFS
jgi:dihydrofolate reductase